MMCLHAVFYRPVKSQIGVMAWLVDFVNHGRSLARTRCMSAMASHAVGFKLRTPGLGRGGKFGQDYRNGLDFGRAAAVDEINNPQSNYDCRSSPYKTRILHVFATLP